MKTILQENTELQEALNASMAKLDDYEIKMHKKTVEHKNELLNQRKAAKKVRAQVDKELKKLVTELYDIKENSTLFVGTKHLTDKFEELKREIIK